MQHNWFPLGIASGEAFCNRVKERAYLKHNIQHGTHTLIASPRRYGKTSLAKRVMTELKLPSAVMEFTLISDLATTQNVIGAAIGKLLIQLAPSHKKALMLASKFFSHLNPKLVIDAYFGAKIELSIESKLSHLNIMELLQQVDKAAGAANKQVVLLMDEFQQIALLEEHFNLEAAIRNAAQQMKYTSIIFSGSNRHLLQLMFENKGRPLYHLCDRLNLQRIHESDYEEYVQKAAQSRWHRKLSAELIQIIFTLTRRHPYYINVLCSRLYHCNELPSSKEAQIIWNEYVEEESDRIGKEISQLSAHQRLMLILAAVQPFSQPSSKNIVEKLKISTANAVKCCRVLVEKDYLYQGKDHLYCVTDPAMEDYLKKQAYLIRVTME